MMTSGMAKLLVVDDDSSNRITMTMLLEEEGFQVCDASSSAEARAKVGSDGPFDVVLLDQQLGDGLGTDLVPELRERMPAAKLLLISGSIDGRDRAAAEFDGYILKGVAFPEVLARIQMVVSQPCS